MKHRHRFARVIWHLFESYTCRCGMTWEQALLFDPSVYDR